MAQQDAGGGVEPDAVVDADQVAVQAQGVGAAVEASDVPDTPVRGCASTTQLARPSISTASGSPSSRPPSSAPGYRHAPMAPASWMAARAESRSVTSVVVPAQLRRPSLTVR